MRKLLLLLCGVVFVAVQAMAQQTVPSKNVNPVPDLSVHFTGATLDPIPLGYSKYHPSLWLRSVDFSYFDKKLFFVSLTEC